MIENYFNISKDSRELFASGNGMTGMSSAADASIAHGMS